jgi:hypothetical protein
VALLDCAIAGAGRNRAGAADADEEHSVAIPGGAVDGAVSRCSNGAVVSSSPTTGRPRHGRASRCVPFYRRRGHPFALLYWLKGDSTRREFLGDMALLEPSYNPDVRWPECDSVMTGKTTHRAGVWTAATKGGLAGWAGDTLWLDKKAVDAVAVLPLPTENPLADLRGETGDPNATTGGDFPERAARRVTVRLGEPQRELAFHADWIEMGRTERGFAGPAAVIQRLRTDHDVPLAGGGWFRLLVKDRLVSVTVDRYDPQPGE